MDKFVTPVVSRSGASRVVIVKFTEELGPWPAGLELVAGEQLSAAMVPSDSLKTLL